MHCERGRVCSCALLQLKESPGPAVPQPVLYCQVLLCKWSESHVGTGWAQAAVWSLLHSLDRAPGQAVPAQAPRAVRGLLRGWAPVVSLGLSC